ncbi:type III secretion system export apparatus subunit SctS [Vibrio aquimaris]|uniref:Flagellar biosynthetic protein FliQ n=1 Tax=Vibrio aquimaris TaxID=2587862 RepID=A0A5P9CN73_9VIBR|nr:type III secretion system export apparatus subunit SctS [Vibrio aquimaris]QFT27739.1 Flagellar biosynthetic protein FliQ [Vibrio aquimaris]
MEESQLISLTAQAMYLTLILSLPTIVVAAAVGVIIALIQALTQVQEQTLAFVVKLVAVVGVMFATGHWFGSQIYHFSLQIFESLPKVL